MGAAPPTAPDTVPETPDERELRDQLGQLETLYNIAVAPSWPAISGQAKIHHLKLGPSALARVPKKLARNHKT
jgi:hypothetical protein